MTRSDCDLIGPILARSLSSALTFRKLVIRPVGGASRTTASYLRAFLFRELRSVASYTLPVSRMSRTPGASVVAKSITPKRSSARVARPSR